MPNAWEEINKILICLRCKNRFDVPKILPCGESICADCIDELKNNDEFMDCPFCDSNHWVPRCSFPTQKLVMRFLNLRLIQPKLYQDIENLINKNLDTLEKFYSKTIDDHIKKVLDYCKKQIQEIEEKIKPGVESTEKKEDMIKTIAAYKAKCVADLKTEGTTKRCAIIAKQKVQINILFMNYKKQLKKWKTDMVAQNNMTEEYADNILRECLIMENVISNVLEFYESIIFGYAQPMLIRKENLSKKFETLSIASDLNSMSISNPTSSLTQYSSSSIVNDEASNLHPEFYYKLRYNDFNYLGIVNADNIIKDRFTKMIQISSCKMLLKDSPNEIVVSAWHLLLNNNNIMILLHVFEISDLSNRKDKLKFKIMDKYQRVLIETYTPFVSREIHMVKSTLNDYFLVVVRNTSTDNYELNAYNYTLDKTKMIYLDFSLLCIDSDIGNIYLLSDIPPYIHVYTWEFDSIVRFGQNSNTNSPFFMQNLTEIFVRYKQLYARDLQNSDIKVYDLYTGIIQNVINIDLRSCLLNIDFLGRIITVNTSNQMMTIKHPGSMFSYENNYKNIDGISCVDIGPGGHLLIYSSRNCVIYIY